MAVLALLGMGGVGKTQIVTEYCHAHWARQTYGLISWLNAESAESLATGNARIETV